MFVQSAIHVAAVGVLIGLLIPTQTVRAQPTGCAPPLRPFVPSDPRDVEDYADLIRQDFETYIADFEGYMRCLDAERSRVFAEAQEVTAEYGRFSQRFGGREAPTQFQPNQSFEADPGWLGDLSPDDRLLLGAPQVVPESETLLRPLPPTLR